MIARAVRTDIFRGMRARDTESFSRRPKWLVLDAEYCESSRHPDIRRDSERQVGEIRRANRQRIFDFVTPTAEKFDTINPIFKYELLSLGNSLNA